MFACLLYDQIKFKMEFMTSWQRKAMQYTYNKHLQICILILRSMC